MNKSLKTLMLVILVSMVLAGLWDKMPIIKDSVHLVLDPTAGVLLSKNVNLGIIVFAAIISFFIILLQKYTTDQDTLREIKKEQKILQEEMKKYKDHPEKLMELQKKQLEFIPKTMEITLRPMMYTSLPIILFFRWFRDYFIAEPTKVFGMNWLLAYILMSMVFTTVFRKVFKVA